jgi:hypothetical protein
MELTNLTSGNTENNNIDSKKRGRKAKQDNYFDVREEQAVRLFLVEQSLDERNRIYNQFLRDPLDKMISSIIRRYKLYRKDMDFQEIHVDTHSFLMTKIDKFKPSKEKKAYSYFGTICKNYLMGQIIKDQKELNRKVSYEDISSSLEENIKFSYSIENDIIDSETIINKFKNELKLYIDEQTMSDNERKLGIALMELFDNYETIFMSADNNKFNKNVILLSLREMTNLTTKEIRNSMKKYKKLYSFILGDVLK